jgi:GNAT superfamily N-acetyltransferase
VIVRRLGPAEAPASGLRADYLADPAVLHWVAEEDGATIGFLHCYVERRRTREPLQLLLYEIEVDEGRRRAGVGRALIAAMEQWMRDHDVVEVWVLADNEGAARFYEACGFVRDEPLPVMLTRRLD